MAGIARATMRAQLAERAALEGDPRAAARAFVEPFPELEMAGE